MNRNTVNTENPKMQRSCKALDLELTKLYRCIEENLAFDTDSRTRFIPYENHDKARRVNDFIRWMSRSFHKYLHSDVEVWKFCGFVNRKIEVLDKEIFRKEHQLSLFPEEEVRQEIETLKTEKRKYEFVRDICHKGAARFDYVFHV